VSPELRMDSSVLLAGFIVLGYLLGGIPFGIVV
jgi:glycerol-3-phosphate acyltransferase PlsY